MPAKFLSAVLLLAVSIVPALSSTFSYTTYSNVPYGSDDEQVMDIYVPIGTTNPSNPTILLIHGGGWVSGDKAELTSSAQYFASQGYTAANINYRLATDTSNQYPTANNDAVRALQFVESNAAVYQVDKTRISAFGTSAGASIALTLGTEDLVNGVMDFYGPTDFTDQNLLNDTFNGESNTAILTTVFGVGLPQGYTLYHDASPIYNLSASFPPTIIFQGELDDTVPYTQSVNLNTQLQTLGVVSDLNLDPTLGHGFLTNGDVADPTTFLAQCTAFLEANPSVITLNFTNWASSYSLTGGPADTPENDGVPNLEKYLFDINPSAPMSAGDRAALPSLGTTKISNTSYLTLTYRQSALETGVTVAVQSSTNLQTWTTDTTPADQPQSTGLTDSADGDPIMQARVPVTGTRQFIRLNVTQ